MLPLAKSTSQFVLIAVALLNTPVAIDAFTIRFRRFPRQQAVFDPILGQRHTFGATGASGRIFLSSESGDETAAADDDDPDSTIFSVEEEGPNLSQSSVERAWRYAKKPLLSIGSKGATLTHGNSLRQLLQQHTVVKVKVNTNRFDGSLQAAFEHLCSLAEQNGAPPGIELIQAREGDKIILFGLPGTMERISRNEFPIVEKKE